MAPPTAIDIEGVLDTKTIVFPDPLTVNGVSARRAKAGKLIAGTAAFTSSDFFKHQVCRPFHCSQTSTNALQTTTGKPKAKRWDRK
jgi:aromatic amino acid aminotransferase I